MFNNFFFENHAVYWMWKNVVEPGRPQIQYGTCAVYGICKVTVTHLEYVILTAFPL